MKLKTTWRAIKIAWMIRGMVVHSKRNTRKSRKK